MKERWFNSIMNSISKANEMIADAITEYVKMRGEDFTEYHRKRFGIDEEAADPDVKVLKVFNIIDNGGCKFLWTPQYQMLDKCEWYSFDFHSLYVVEENGDEYLKCHMLENEGIWDKPDKSCSRHSYVSELSPQIIDKLVSFIFDYENGRK